MPSLFPQPGPALPCFKSLLVKGKYHPSAPLHLSLTYVSENTDSRVILISSSRQNLAVALQHCNDEWLMVNSGLGKITSLSSRIQLFYPTSPAQMCFLFSMFSVPRNTGGEGSAWINAKTALPTVPALILLLEPSAHFLSSNGSFLPSSHQTISSYLSLVAHALSCATSLSEKSRQQSSTVSFALFDSRLDELRLPMVKPPISLNTDVPDARDVSRLEPVSAFVQRYFDCQIIASQGDSSLDGLLKRSMTLQTNRAGESNKLWTWWESSAVVESETQKTRLIWDL